MKFKPPAVEQFFRTKSMGPFAVSNDEERLVIATNLDGKPNVWAVDLDDRFPYPLTMIDQGVALLEYGPDDEYILTSFDRDGDENYQIYALPPGGGQPVDVVTGKPDEKYFFHQLSADGRYIYYSTSEGNPTFLNICRFDMELEESEVLLEGKETVAELQRVSPNGASFVYGRAYGNTFQPSFLYRDGESTPLVPDPTVTHVCWTPRYVDENTIFFATDFQADFRYLARYRVEEGQFDMVAGLDGESIKFIEHDDLAGQLWVVSEAGVEDRLYSYDLEAGQLTRHDLPVTSVRQLKLGESGSPYLLGMAVRSPQNVYRLKEGEWECLTNNRVLGVSEEDMAEAQVVSYESFDGLPIEGLFFEANPDRASGWTVLWPHGGPQARVDKVFNPIFQLLAYAGYKVFAPNFRGSTGYGSAFTRMIEREWGEAPRKDIMAGLRQLVERGTIDPDRVVAIGGSFGGYMTLLLHGRHAAEFQAFVDIFGPSDLLTFVNSVPAHWKPMMRNWLGDPEDDRERLSKDSPITYLENMTKPMLVVQGANDPRVVKAESDQIVEALRNRGTPVEYMVLEGEGHGFTKKENETKVYRRVLDFLEKHCSV